MINNGGGLFNADKKPDCVTPENIEAMEFVLDLVKSGYSDPAAATYTSDNVQAQWKAKKFGFGWDGAGLLPVLSATSRATSSSAPADQPERQEGWPVLPEQHHDVQEHPEPEGLRGVPTYYYQNMKELWTKKTGIGLPPLKSIAETPEFKSNANNVKIVEEWQPIFKTWAAPGTTGLFANIANTVDGTAPMITFAQAILGGKTDAKAALTTLQTSMEGLMK